MCNVNSSDVNSSDMNSSDIYKTNSAFISEFEQLIWGYQRELERCELERCELKRRELERRELEQYELERCELKRYIQNKSSLYSEILELQQLIWVYQRKLERCELEQYELERRELKRHVQDKFSLYSEISELQQLIWGHNLPYAIPTGSSTQAPENKRKVLRILLKNKEHLVCPDSGSEKNIMAETFASKHGFKIRRSPKDINRFELGNGKYTLSVGRACLLVGLVGNTISRKKRWFHIIPECPVPLILGMPFLKEAEILTRNRHLLEDCSDTLRKLPSFFWIGSPRQRLRCILDGRNFTAVADTGSDLNLISLKCAKRGGFHIDRRREARKRIQVGDGTEAETIGQVHVYDLSLDWRKAESAPYDEQPPSPSFGATLEPTAISQDKEMHNFGAVFHVLPGLPCDIIFGRDLLDQTDAFNLCPDLLGSEVALKDNPFEFNILINLGPVSVHFPLSRRKRRLTIADPRERHDDEKHAEMHRRSKKEEEIAAMPGNEQARAKTVERRVIGAYESRHATCIYCHP